MGLLSAYLGYRYGKKKAMSEALRLERDRAPRLDDVCANCGWELRFHSDDSILSCPIDDTFVELPLE
jgi:hypothetical protein